MLSQRVIRLCGDILRGDFEIVPKAGEPVIWAFPVYSWGVPPVVKEFIGRCRISEAALEATHHALITYGDDAALTALQWRRLMRRRGMKTAGIYGLTMPNTYVLMKGFDVDSPELAAEKLRTAEMRLPAIARMIAEDTGGKQTEQCVRGRMAWLKSRIVYPLFVRFCMSAKPFHATTEYILCRRCEYTCPENNITSDSEAGTMKWGNRCALCLGCYHVCPQHAVAYGKATADKGQKQILKE